MSKLKAYAVLEKYEMTGDIYFAEKSIYAAKWGANEYADGELGGVQCRRAPWADQYAKTGVPAKVAVEYGWHFECVGCGITVDSDLPYERRLPVNGICGKVSGAVYCSPRCKWNTMRHDLRRKAQQLSAIEDFKRIVADRFPDVEFVEDKEASRGHHAYITEGKRGGWHRGQVIIAFNFPGMKIGPAHFRMDQFYKIGPPEAGYTCCNGDADAFMAYAAQHPKRRVVR
jgi:hypothetical protein